MEQLGEQIFYMENQTIVGSLRPNTTTYNLVLQAWSKANILHSNKNQDKRNMLTPSLVADHCEGIRNHMEHLSHAQPNKTTYCSVLHALAKCGTRDAVLKSLQILKTVNDKLDRAVLVDGMSTKDAANEFLPDSVCYNRVIDALAKSRIPDAHHKAKQTLEHMKRLGVTPDIFTYSSVLSACAFATGSVKTKRKAFNMGMELMEELQIHPEYGVANQVTYGTMIRACENLLPEGNERDWYVSKIVHKCREEKLVNDRIMRQVKRAASKELYKNILQQ